MLTAQSYHSMDAADEDDNSISSSDTGNADEFRLRLVSFGKANGPPDLAHAHQLLFSVRDLPSPPARLRKAHTGLSSHLRKEVLAGKGAEERLLRIESSILQEMARLEQLWRPQDVCDGEDQTGLVQADGATEPRLLQVGIFCEEGKHRSVSFVHELARRKGLKQQGWYISTVHRDLGISDAESDRPVPTPASVKKKRDRQRRNARWRQQPESRNFKW